ncbi:hypothetical protein G6F59_017732 [Rhizopus arrhizus]|nr:hypothetical protein G6F59_017732 [Rhizopus arrhizus]
MIWPPLPNSEIGAKSLTGWYVRDLYRCSLAAGAVVVGSRTGSPAGAARAPAAAPIMALAPGLFSTTKVCPSSFDSAGVTERAVMSDEPPGTKGTLMVTGVSG